jgi:phosphate transport system substrate-binding protein
MNPGVTVTVSGGGSSAGVTGVATGTCDIGMASRGLKTTETDTYPDLNATAITKDGIAVIVNNANPIGELTSAQIKGIFNGTITNWSNATAFGGDAWDDAEIVVMNRDSASGTREFFHEWMGLDFVSTASEFDSNGAVKTAVIGAQYAIGYVGLGYVDSQVSTIEIDGVLPTQTTVQDLTYPISRDLYMVTMGTLETQTVNVQAFFSFVLGRNGQYISKDEGFVPLPGYIL